MTTLHRSILDHLTGTLLNPDRAVDQVVLTTLTDDIMAMVNARWLWGAGEIVAYTGRPKTTVQGWYRATRRARSGFPAPAYELTAGPFWWAEDVKAWCTANRHLIDVPK